MSDTVIDAWMQHPTLRHARHPMFESLRRWTRSAAPEREIPLAQTIQAMDEGNVAVGLTCAWYAPEGALISNDEVASYTREFPDRIVGVAGADLRRPMAAVRELRRSVETLGFRALRIVSWLWDLPPNDRRYYPLYAECVHQDVPVCLQVGHTGPLRSSETGRPIPYIDDVALEFPELRIVCGHIGFPWTLEMISLATKYENVFIDTSAWVAHRFPPELVQFMRGSGRKKVLFGTNYPMLTSRRCLEKLDQLGLDDDARRLFLGDNARRVFGLAETRHDLLDEPTDDIDRALSDSFPASDPPPWTLGRP